LAPVRIKALFGRVALILTVLVAAVVAGVSASVVAGMFTSDQRSMALELPMALPYAAFPIGFALIALVAAAQLFASSRANPAGTTPPPERKGAS
jgi:TRAP-type C4-dicarboxylate transport system permease small subunit